MDLNMATAQTSEELLKCSICYGQYKKPRKLPGCFHVFCENCLLTYITNLKSNKEDVLEFQCPNCRKKTSLPRATEDLETWVKALDGFDAGNIAMDMALEGEGENASELCISCKGVEKKTTAEKYCVECSEFLCSTCSQMIHSVKNLKSHMVINRSERIENEKDTGTTTLFANYFSCSKHPERLISCICGEHTALICMKCLLDEHKNCREVFEIQERASASENETELKKLKEQINKLSEQIKVIQDFKKNQVTDQKQKVEEIRRQIQEMRTKVNNIFDSVEENICSQAKALVKENTLMMDEEIHQLQNMGKPLKLFTSLIETIKGEGSNTHLFIILQKLKIDVNDIKNKVLEMSYSENPELKMNVSELLNKLAEHNPEDTQTLATIETILELTLPPNFPEEDELLVAKTISKSAEYKILAKESPGNSPTYSDIQYLTNNQFLLVDTCYEMCCLTDSRYIPTKSLKLGKNPNRATSLGNGKIALTIHNEKAIYILSDSLQTEDEISSRFVPKAICGLKNGHLAVSWRDPVAFGIIALQSETMDGKGTYKYKDIVYFDHDRAQRQFRSFDYIAVDERRRQIIQPCTLDKAVYGFDFSGNPRFKYTHEELVSPSGVACDCDGYIYVCETERSCIYMLSPKGAGIRTIKEGLKKPLALSVNANSTELAVTQACSLWRKVTVLKIVCDRK